MTKKKTVSCIRNRRKQQNKKQLYQQIVSLSPRLCMYSVLDTVADYNRVIVYTI